MAKGNSSNTANITGKVDGNSKPSQAVTIAKSVHSAVYSTSSTAQHQAISCYYDQNSIFEDPLVQVRGINNVMTQLESLPLLFSVINPHLHNVTEGNGAMGTTVVIVDSTVSFGFKSPMPISLPRIGSSETIHMDGRRIVVPVRMMTRYEFSPEGKITLHQDLWSLTDLVQNLPIIGGIYSKYIRGINGMVSNWIMLRFVQQRNQFKQ